ncbi:phage holin family protein [Phascolarctobacterium sp.]|uniref:phage holin family protein n=1 Tax=Phascolarctobacterium sp. TaxID=2049039 RepID=UPI00386BE0AB
MDKLLEVLTQIMHNKIIVLVMVAVCFDTVFGVIRAIKEHKFNSCFGIDGAIRKISMVISIAGLAIVDRLVNINLIGFIPEEARAYIGMDVIGTAEFFGLLYICYEVVSILKNMYLCGLPVRWVWARVEKFLHNYTDELPDNADELVINKPREIGATGTGSAGGDEEKKE